jgi:hypothetical protein
MLVECASGLSILAILVWSVEYYVLLTGPD